VRLIYSYIVSLLPIFVFLLGRSARYRLLTGHTCHVHYLKK